MFNRWRGKQQERADREVFLENGKHYISFDSYDQTIRQHENAWAANYFLKTENRVNHVWQLSQAN